MNNPVQVFYESTPNPQSMKFVVDQVIASENAPFATADSAGRSPLARKIFGFPWAAGVFIGSNFVTITKQEWVDWQVLADPLSHLIQEHIQSGDPVLLPAEATSVQPNDTPVVQQIKQILDAEIRPAVAMDGGDIVFQKYEDGIVYLFMQGSCAGCPSSTMTLKQGIESRLMAAIPEIKEVVAV